MAVPTLGNVSSANSSGSSVTIAHNSNGTTLVVWATVNGSPAAIGTATFNGVTMTKIQSGDSNKDETCMFYLDNPGQGVHNVVVNFNNSPPYSVYCESWVNGHYGTSNIATGTSTSGSVSLAASSTAVKADALGRGSVGSVATPSMSSQFTLDANNAHMAGSTGAGTLTGSGWSWTTSASWVLIIANIEYYSPSSILKVAGVVRASISKVEGVALASVGKIAGLS
jgi:hypothetical protein